VDVASGVEESKGIKSPQKVAAFIAAVRAAENA
jgi:phosphoribosylanthranilate isomerase